MAIGPAVVGISIGRALIGKEAAPPALFFGCADEQDGNDSATRSATPRVVRRMEPPRMPIHALASNMAGGTPCRN